MIKWVINRFGQPIGIIETEWALPTHRAIATLRFTLSKAIRKSADSYVKPK